MDKLLVLDSLQSCNYQSAFATTFTVRRKTDIKWNVESEFTNLPVVYSCLVCIIKVRAVYGTWLPCVQSML